MCNRIHSEHTSIEQSGHAWKIFKTYGDGILYQLFSGYDYTKEKSGWIQYLKDGYYDDGIGDGFCAFAREEEAKRALDDLQIEHSVIREIQYEGGLSLQSENLMVYTKTYETIIITRFKVIEEWRKYV